MRPTTLGKPCATFWVAAAGGYQRPPPGQPGHEFRRRASQRFTTVTQDMTVTAILEDQSDGDDGA